MNYQITATNGNVDVQLKGEIYVEESALIREEMLQYIQDGHKNLRIDMSNVTFIDSSGLGVLVAIQKRAIQNGGAVTIIGLKGSVLELFELTRLNKVFTME
ncbi:STAS domain-containing protein [Brevibacillus fluminis]|uniref:STAS domain-containing protein n=1 Tax=Brevibacillus fluminis TaxID=511487 RepID=UPI003F8CEF46